MSVLTVLREVTGTDSYTLHECRHCGLKLPEGVSECQNCGADEIAYYEL